VLANLVRRDNLHQPPDPPITFSPLPPLQPGIFVAMSVSAQLPSVKRRFSNVAQVFRPEVFGLFAAANFVSEFFCDLVS
jgi:hypothetical protein